MFIDNKYLLLYNRLIESSRLKNTMKIKGDGLQIHHIIPRCFGGSDEDNNLVYMTFKEHKLAHKILIKITTGNNKYKMMWAYKLFDKGFNAPAPPGWNVESHNKGVKTRKIKGSYKRGKHNIFSSEKIKNIVKKRMINNNPMFNEQVKQKYLKNRPHSNHVITPTGYFYSVRAAARAYNVSDYEMKKIISSCIDNTFILLKAGDRH